MTRHKTRMKAGATGQDQDLFGLREGVLGIGTKQGR